MTREQLKKAESIQNFIDYLEFLSNVANGDKRSFEPEEFDNIIGSNIVALTHDITFRSKFKELIESELSRYKQLFEEL